VFVETMDDVIGTALGKKVRGKVITKKIPGRSRATH
jgi:hypothetical protein